MAIPIMHRRGVSLPIQTDGSDDPSSSEMAAEREYGRQQCYHEKTLPELCREIAIAHGHPKNIEPNEAVRVAMSTGDAANVFTQVLNASMTAAFKSFPDTSKAWTREALVENYMDHETFRLASLGNMEVLPRGGTAAHCVVSDVVQTYKAIRFAKAFMLDEMDIIDDRLGALFDIPTQIGQTIGRLRSDMVYATLLESAALSDGTALFHADHNNYVAGGGTVLTTASLGTALKSMGEQTEDGVRLALYGAFLIVPPALLLTALSILHATDRAGENIQVISEPRIGAAGVVDPVSGDTRTGSDSHWFLTCSPIQGPTFEVGFLMDTGAVPVLRSYPLDSGAYGQGWDVEISIGVKPLDHRGIYKSLGDA